MILSSLPTIILRKTRTLVDRPYSVLELSPFRGSFREPLSYYERTIVRHVGPYLTNDISVVYDIGAHLGNYSQLFAKASTVDAVIAFEPTPEVFQQLSARMAKYSRVQCFNTALGDEATTATFYKNERTSSSSLLPMKDLHKTLFRSTAREREISVPVARLDDLIREHSLPMPDLIKIDVQGFEDRVIAGGIKAIANSQKCIIEISLLPLYEGAKGFDEIYSTMKSLGFEVAGMAGETTTPDGQQAQVDVVFRRIDR